MTPTRQFYRPQEIRARFAAAGIDVTIRTIYRWIESGKLPSARLPGGLRIPARSVDELLRESQDGA